MYILRPLCNSLHYVNYAGLVLGGAFTFTRTSSEKQSVFLQNSTLHFCFFANSYCLAFMKLAA